MFEALSERLEGVLKKLKGRGLLREEDIVSALKEIKIALLEADVNFKVVKDFTEKVRVKAIGKEVIESITPGQQVVKIVHDELCRLMGGGHSKINLSPNPPTVLMFVGIHGSGKTTSAAKLAKRFKKDGRRPMLVALDTARPAAIEQLTTLGTQIDVPVYATNPGDSPVKIGLDAVKQAHAQGRDVMILDTAGRLHIDEQLMNELDDIKREVNPKEILLVADAMTGQDAVNIAKSFNERLGIDGIILTKMEGDARGGAALSMISVTGKPIKFIGVGEKIDSLEPFHPDRMASRILGMGDVVTLVEKAQDTVDINEAAQLQKKLSEDKFTFDDLKNQLNQIRKMGPLENILAMIPGLGKQLKGHSVDDRALIKIDAIINSMTKQERTNYAIINASRKRRIALGSGTTVPDVNRLIKQYIGMKKMMKTFRRSGKFKLGNFLNSG
ncbi:MAG: signal recognition particle protein [Thermodesulfovibrionia bacterium]|nr:signal recognition particle protein [Thermodesulfovibrionia bacterium]MCK5511535.1 signal recognition particle protein [Thermodesulfovibrionia bacterium]